LNEPRYPSLKGMMAAKKKPLDVVTPDVSAPRGGLTWSAPYAPARSTAGVVVQGKPATEAAAELVDWLKERKLI